MPSGTLPVNNYLGDPQRTTAEFQTAINELLAYTNSLKAEVGALPDTTLRSAAVKPSSDFLASTVYQEQLGIAMGGDFDAGALINVVRIGRTVTITVEDDSGFAPNHISKFNPFSANGVVPVWARPSQQVRNCYSAGDSYVETFFVNSGGQVLIQYRDWTGAQVSRIYASSKPNISYVI